MVISQRNGEGAVELFIMMFSPVRPVPRVALAKVSNCCCAKNFANFFFPFPSPAHRSKTSATKQTMHCSCRSLKLGLLFCRGPYGWPLRVKVSAVMWWAAFKRHPCVQFRRKFGYFSVSLRVLGMALRWRLIIIGWYGRTKFSFVVLLFRMRSQLEIRLSLTWAGLDGMSQLLNGLVRRGKAFYALIEDTLRTDCPETSI